MKKYNLAILKNDTPEDHLPWVESCDKFSDRVTYKVIDFMASDWLEKSLAESYDFFLTRAPGRIAYYKQLFDERIYILNKVLGLRVYPTLNELLIYENKRMLSCFVKANNIPHPATRIIYDKQEALEFAKNCDLPLVAKTNIGAGGSGVKIFKNRKEIIEYVEGSFSVAGIKRTFLPNFRKGDYLKRFMNRMKNVSETVEYFREKKRAATVDPQKWFVIFQEFIQSDYEWRCVVINGDYFGHKKLRTIGEMMSGTSKVSWDVPDPELLHLLKEIMEKNNLWCQAVDLFYNEQRGYLVNELQCFWGSKNPHQMIRDGIPGKFVFRDNTWAYVEGEYNTNNSYDLRLKHVLRMLDEKNG
jgi:glutathione synthase/RimK-type ligase-like ATP-grasp enzyme